MKKIKRVYVDPPQGYLYGFPKAVPDEYVEDGVIVFMDGYKQWLAAEYPNETIWLRSWVREEESN